MSELSDIWHACSRFGPHCRHTSASELRPCLMAFSWWVRPNSCHPGNIDFHQPLWWLRSPNWGRCLQWSTSTWTAEASHLKRWRARRPAGLSDRSREEEEEEKPSNHKEQHADLTCERKQEEERRCRIVFHPWATIREEHLILWLIRCCWGRRPPSSDARWTRYCFQGYVTFQNSVKLIQNVSFSYSSKVGQKVRLSNSYSFAKFRFIHLVKTSLSDFHLWTHFKKPAPDEELELRHTKQDAREKCLFRLSVDRKELFT